MGTDTERPGEKYFSCCWKVRPVKNSHRGCVICNQFHRYRSALRAENTRKMRQVYSACLTAHGPWSRKSGQNSKKPLRFAASEASTDPNLVWLETSGRYDQCAP